MKEKVTKEEVLKGLGRACKWSALSFLGESTAISILTLTGVVEAGKALKVLTSGSIAAACCVVASEAISIYLNKSRLSETAEDDIVYYDYDDSEAAQ